MIDRAPGINNVPSGVAWCSPQQIEAMRLADEIKHHLSHPHRQKLSPLVIIAASTGHQTTKHLSTH